MKLGADPEVFLVNATGDLISAIGRIGGSKERPRRLPIGDGYAVQEDNVALEYNIPPAADQEAFVKHIMTASSFLAAEVKKIGLKFSAESAAFFPKSQLMHPKAREFGCDPDFDAWNGGEQNPRPHATDETLRSCGGHVHVGITISNDELLDTIKRADLMLAVPATLMDINGGLRRKLYGKRGAFRPKPYGFEYRVLSNFWTFKPEYVRWVWNNMRLALETKHLIPNIDAEDNNISLAVNEGNTEVAEMLVKKYNIPMVIV